MYSFSLSPPLLLGSFGLLSIHKKKDHLCQLFYPKVVCSSSSDKAEILNHPSLSATLLLSHPAHHPALMTLPV